MGWGGVVFRLFLPRPAPISNPQTAFNKDTLRGAGILSGIYVILILFCKK
jgi:hypothetical protein